MDINYKRLVKIRTIPATATAVYTNATGKKTHVRLIQLYNDNSTAETVKLYNVPVAAGVVGTAAASNKFFEYAMAANETKIITYDIPGIMLEDFNDSIQAETTTAAKVTIEITGAII